MKTTLMYLVITIKTLSAYFIVVLLFALVFSSCQTEDVAPLRGSVPSVPNEGAPVVVPYSIAPDEVVRTDYPLATQWRITYNNVNVYHRQSYQRFFSTEDGSMYTLADVNTNVKTTARVDMNIMFWYVSSLKKDHYSLNYPEYVSPTRFKLAEFGAWQLAVITGSNTPQFQMAYERNPSGATPFQPYNYEMDGDESTFVKKGDIVLFKTGGNDPRYGAVRIVEKANPFPGNEQTIVEVTVQRANHLLDLGS